MIFRSFFQDFIHIHNIHFLCFLFLEKYPQIKKLFGYDPNFKWVVTAMVFTQFLLMFILRDKSWPVLLLVAYCLGGVINHSLMLGNSLNTLF